MEDHTLLVAAFVMTILIMLFLLEIYRTVLRVLHYQAPEGRSPVLNHLPLHEEHEHIPKGMRELTGEAS